MNLLPSRPIIVIIRGPMGAGKTTLMHGLARHPRYRFWALDADAANDHHPQDPHGDHLDVEWPIEDAILALHSKIVLNRRRNLVLDPGGFLTAKNVDRFLRRLKRTRSDRRVILIRLAVELEEAVRRKQSVRPDEVRASHAGWQPTAVPGEIAIDTSGRRRSQVLREAKRGIDARLRDRTPLGRGNANVKW